MRSCAPLIVLLLPQLSVAGAIDPSGGFPQHDSRQCSAWLLGTTSQPLC